MLKLGVSESRRDFNEPLHIFSKEILLYKSF